MPYESGEEAVRGDVVCRDRHYGTVVEVHGDELIVQLQTGTERWHDANCRLMVPVEGIRPRPGWEPAWIGALGRQATKTVERGLVYIRRTDDHRFLVVDGRDDTSPHRIVGDRPGYASLDDAYRIADYVLDEEPALRHIAEQVRSEHPELEEVGVVPFVDSTGDDALRVVIVLPERDGGRLYTHDELRPIARSVTAATRDQERIVYTTFRLSSEMDPQGETETAANDAR